MGEHIDQPSVYGSVTGNNGVAEELLFLHAEMGALVGDKCAYLSKRPFIQKLFYPFSGRKFAFFMLILDAFLTTALQGFLLHALQLFYLFQSRHLNLLQESLPCFPPRVS